MRGIGWLIIIVSTGMSQSIPFPGPGGVSGYTGPGNVISGAVVWWGLRAYSAAKAGTKAANICNAADVNCADINTLANGNFDMTTVQAAPLNCLTGTCTVKTLYDQTAGGNCAGTCDLTQATIALRPVLTFNCIDSLPCMTWTATKFMLTAQAITVPMAQPYSASAVGERTGAFTSFADLTANATNVSGDIQLGFANAANTLFLFSGSVATKASVADSSPHAVQGLFSGAASKLYADGSLTSSLNAGTNTAAFKFCMGMCNNGLVGLTFEAGWWLTDTSANFAAMNSNQHAYWGF